MATTRSFSDMLNEYLPYELLEGESVKRNFVLSNVEQDNSWKGGNLVVPFYGSYASSLEYGALTDQDDIAEDDYVRGGVSGYKELWGTMKFNAKDLDEHGQNEQSLIGTVTKTADGFLQRMKEASSVNFLVGSHIATLTANGGTAGEATVDHPERFTIGQKVYIDDNDSIATVAYVRTINMNTKTLTLFDARTAGAAINLTTIVAGGYTTAQAAKLYHPGAQPTVSSSFTGLPQQLLSAANGGDTNLFGVAKTAFPYLQAQNVSGAGWTVPLVLDNIFDAWTEVQRYGRGGAKKTAVMGYGIMGHVMKRLQAQSGPFRFVKSKADLYGWTELSVIGVRGELTLTAVQEADEDKVMFLDWSGIKLHTNGLFAYQKDPEGKMYFTRRGTTGYQYLIDAKMFGELIVNMPCTQGIVHSIPNPLTP